MIYKLLDLISNLLYHSFQCSQPFSHSSHQSTTSAISCLVPLLRALPSRCTSVEPFSISCFNSTYVAWQETNCHVNHEARKAPPHEQQNKVNSRQERAESAGEFGVALANLWTFRLDESTTNTRSKQAE